MFAWLTFDEPLLSEEMKKLIFLEFEINKLEICN